MTSTCYAFRDPKGREAHEKRKLPLNQPHTTTRIVMESRIGLLVFPNLIDALGFARSPILATISASDTYDTEHYSLAVTQRPLAQSNVKDRLRSFSRSLAFRFIDQWQCPPAVSKFLRTGDKALLSDAKDAVDDVFFDDRLDGETIPYLMAFSAICGDPHTGARSCAVNSGLSKQEAHDLLLEKLT